MRVLLALFLVATWVMSPMAYADDRPALQILVDEPGDEGIKCGVTQQTMLAPALQALKDIDADFQKEFSSPYLYIQADFRFRDEPRLCSWRGGLSIRALPTTDRHERFPQSGFERVLLCEAELSGSASNNVSKSLSDNVQDYLKACLAAVKY